ncbi:flavin reductase [Xylophilus sp. GOD-11R]|uniref:flavin reductase n=1 Tax=Xylophilus sp. GOD-11R TaxID=3089814 RepID=UPI00298BF4CA|nr:flavin reductase [Xylophilus sp. GOD-11R]WPB55452.1 flavin reductase [Xylophilus sp. GOD-11R]
MSQTPPDANARSFRHALGCFPTGVAVITTTDAQGQPVGLTCNSFSSVSLEPPLVLWSLRNNSKSIDIFRKTEQFAINVLSHRQDDISGRFASSSKSMAEKFDGVATSRGWGGTPVLDDCIANFQCSVYARHEAGDHVVFIGQVEAFEQSSPEDALVFYKGAYMMLAQSLRALALKDNAAERDLIQARAAVLGSLVRLAAVAARQEDFDAIEQNLRVLDRHAEEGDMVHRAEAAIVFFKQLTAAAHNDMLTVVAQSLTTMLEHTVSHQVAHAQAHAIYLPALTPLRWRVLEGMKARDPDAAADAMARYFALVAASRAQAELSPA